MQAILYQSKRDVGAWKRLGCPQRMQRTWWQIVATPYTGFRLLKVQPNIMNISCSYTKHSALQWQQQNINQNLNSPKTPHSSPSWVSYGVSVVSILEKIDSVMIAPHCVMYHGTWVVVLVVVVRIADNLLLEKGNQFLYPNILNWVQQSQACNQWSMSCIRLVRN